jgi:NAD+ synthase
MKDPEKVIPRIVGWLTKQGEIIDSKGWVIGVSGGIDSALTSTLCAMTGQPTLTVSMPINQAPDQHSRSEEHQAWLKKRHPNVERAITDLTDIFDSFEHISSYTIDGDRKLALANTASRVRAVMLYMFANVRGMLVVGTGNKVEDHGVGFFTKYGDGAVDLSPIADLTKTEVRACAKHLGVLDSIITAIPTDGLWDDNRSDEEQIGATYEELEWAMAYHDNIMARGAEVLGHQAFMEDSDTILDFVKNYEVGFTDRQREVLKIYLTRHFANAHKLQLPPVCDLSGI